MILLATLAWAGPCEEAAARVGHTVCATAVRDAATWKALTMGATTRWTRYLVPAREDARLPTLVADRHHYELHLTLLRDAFAPLFPGLDQAGYARLVLNPSRREFYGGNLVEHVDQGTFVFTVEEVGSGPVAAADITRVGEALAKVVTFRTPTFEPTDEQAARGLGTIRAAGTYEVYSEAEAYGVVRRVRAEALPDDLSPRDVLVLDAAPWDLPIPVAAAVTAKPTGKLSHLSVRSNARGTPACYDADALTTLAPWEGRLVKITCGPEGLRVEAGDPALAATWEANRRPAPVSVPSVLPEGKILGLRELPTGTAEERALAVRRYGAKGANYAALVQRVPAEWVYEGLLVPLRGYLEFAGQPREGGSFTARILALLPDPVARRTGLGPLREAMENAAPPPALVTELSERVAKTFGEGTMVRFRSSSNAEDDPRFPAAGLYESTSVCVADDRDADGDGPSRCDAATKKERGVARGLGRVWASLWSDRAVSEREWFGITPGSVAMGILVDPRAQGERANIVAFTGSPNGRRGDARAFLVEAQAGEAEVVSADPGVWPEQVRLVPEGKGFRIERITRSSLAAQVVDDTTLRELGARLLNIEEVFPVDVPLRLGEDVVLDTEWKVLADGRLVVKQVRPFVRGN